MKIIIGLGNPGIKYKGTRHNIGYDVVDNLSRRHNINLNKQKFNSMYGEGRINGEKVILLKPLTYMNKSGLAVSEVINFYKVHLKDVIIVVDDIDIKFATIRIKQKGSAGSHNGLKSVINSIGDNNIPRLKIGVGNKKNAEQDLADFVMGKFDKLEYPEIKETINHATLALEDWIKYDILEVMNKYN